MVSRRPPHATSIAIAATVAAACAAPAIAHAQDPILEPLPLPDVRELPVVRDVPIVQSAPDVRELPVVDQVTEPAATPALPPPPAPSAPAVPQSVSAPSVESGGSTSGGGGSATGGGSSSGTATAPRQAATQRTRSTGGPGAAGTPRRVTTVGRRLRADGRPPAPVERRERRLRRTVHRLSGCLDVLGPGSRRVLVLRAGLGERDPLSRRAVAERLDASIVQVTRSERRGVSELRAAARAGRCGAQSTTPTATAAAGAGAPSGAAGGTPPPATAADAGGSGRDADEAGRHVGEAAPRPRSGVGGDFRSSPPASPGTRVLRIAGDAPPVVLLLVLAFLGGFGTVWTLQRRGARRGHLA